MKERYKKEFKEDEHEDEEFFIDKYAFELRQFAYLNNYYKMGGNGLKMAIEAYARQYNVDIKGLDLKYIIKNIFWS